MVCLKRRHAVGHKNLIGCLPLIAPAGLQQPGELRVKRIYGWRIYLPFAFKVDGLQVCLSNGFRQEIALKETIPRMMQMATRPRIEAFAGLLTACGGPVRSSAGMRWFSIAACLPWVSKAYYKDRRKLKRCSRLLATCDMNFRLLGLCHWRLRCGPI